MTAGHQVGAQLMQTALPSSRSKLPENHQSFKQHGSTRAGAPLVFTWLHKNRKTPHHKKVGTPAGGKEAAEERRDGMEMAFSHLWQWPDRNYVLQPQIMKADEALAFTHMAILFRAQIIQWFQKPHSTYFEESKRGLPSPYNKQVLPRSSL